MVVLTGSIAPSPKTGTKETRLEQDQPGTGPRRPLLLPVNARIDRLLPQAVFCCHQVTVY